MKIVLIYTLIALIISIIMCNIIESSVIFIISLLSYSICDIISFIILHNKFNIDLEFLSKYFTITVLICCIIFILLTLIQIIFVDRKYERCYNLIKSGHEDYRIYSQFINCSRFDTICLTFSGWTAINAINMIVCDIINSINNI